MTALNQTYDYDRIARLENDIVHLRNAVVVAYVMVGSDDTSGAALGALSVFRHVLEETGGFQRAMHPEQNTEHNEVKGQ